MPFKWVGSAWRERFSLKREAEVLLAGGPGPENEAADSASPARVYNGSPARAGPEGIAEVGALNLLLITEGNGHVTVLLKLQPNSGSRQESFMCC